MKLKFECPMTWSDLEGMSGVRRHCNSCDHDVINLSGMTRAQARRTIARHEGRSLCVHFASRNGEILHAGDPLLQLEVQRRGAGKLLAAAMLVQTAFAIVADQPLSDFYYDPFAVIGISTDLFEDEPINTEPTTIVQGYFDSF